MHPPIQAFLLWAEQQNIKISPHVEITYDNVTEDYSVKSNADAAVMPPEGRTVIATVPKMAVLSTRTCSYAGPSTSPGAMFALSLAVYWEILKGPQSRWYPYLCCLPQKTVPVATLWGHPGAFPDDEDAKEARRWLAGTEIQQLLHLNNRTPITDALNAYYMGCVQPAVATLGLKATLAGFLHAFSLASSRAIYIDSFHGLALVPFVDMLNRDCDGYLDPLLYGGERERECDDTCDGQYDDVCDDCNQLCRQPNPPIHHCAKLFIERAVCKLCGNHSPCFHEYGFSIPPATIIAPNRDAITVSIPSTLRGRDICLSYGAGLTNAFFLASRGFTPERNGYNAVTFGWPGSGIDLAQEGAAGVLWRHIYHRVKEEVGRVMKNTWIIDSSPSAFDAVPALSLNWGCPSVGLFVWVLMKALRRASYPVQTNDLPQLIIKLAQEMARIYHSGVKGGPDVISYHAILRDAVDLLYDLVDRRWYLIWPPDFHNQNMPGDDSVIPYADGPQARLGRAIRMLPPENYKTKLAMKYVCEEASILEQARAERRRVDIRLNWASPESSDPAQGPE